MPPKTKDIDPKLAKRQKEMEKVAKLVSKNTRVPLPMVARVIMANGFTDQGIKRSMVDCRDLAAKQLDKDMKAWFNL